MMLRCFRSVQSFMLFGEFGRRVILGFQDQLFIVSFARQDLFLASLSSALSTFKAIFVLIFVVIGKLLLRKVFIFIIIIIDYFHLL